MCEIIPFPNSQDLAGLRAADLPSSQERPCRHGQLARGRGGCSGDMEGVGGEEVEYYSLNSCIPQEFIGRNLNPQYDGIRRWGGGL